MTIVKVFENELNRKLDKIRADLHATAELHDDGDYYLREEWIDEYFDKYKSESIKRVRMSKEQFKAINDFWKEYTGRELYKDEKQEPKTGL